MNLHANRKQEVVDREVEDAIRWFYSVHVGAKRSVRLPVLRGLLLHVDNMYIRNGVIHEIRSKSLGGGIYHAWMVPA